MSRFAQITVGLVNFALVAAAASAVAFVALPAIALA